ncbi:hypothetical protein HDU84_000376, partial [Entophlyctis sp. JEL0112]
MSAPAPENLDAREMLVNVHAMVEALRQAVNGLTVGHNALQNEVQSIQTAPPPTNVAASSRAPDFKMPSIKPIKFSGNIKHMPAHRLQNYLDDYLERSLETCKLYNFTSEPATVSQCGQPTYVQFVSSGLADQAHTAWRRLTAYERENMTWDGYRSWILTTFGSTLTLAQVVEAMEELRQTRSALIYSAKFNQLVSAIKATGVIYPEEHLCIKYLNGLRPNLQTIPDLYRIIDDLGKLQRKAKKLDNIQFRRLKKSYRPINNTFPQQQTSRKTTYQESRHNTAPHLTNTFPCANDSPAPMDLDNEEKQTYREKGWCLYCKKKDHSIAACPTLKARKGHANAVAAKNLFRQLNAAIQAD